MGSKMGMTVYIRAIAVGLLGRGHGLVGSRMVADVMGNWGCRDGAAHDQGHRLGERDGEEDGSVASGGSGACGDEPSVEAELQQSVSAWHDDRGWHACQAGSGGGRRGVE